MLIFATAWLLFVCLNGPCFAYPSVGHDRNIKVRSGESIQVAIDTASPGTHITVLPGIYAEQLSINKDGISLYGKGAILIPPNIPIQNICTGIAGNETSAGICITGSGIELAPFEAEHRKVLSVAQPVQDVSITGFTVRDFDGGNIMVVGAKNAGLEANSLYNGGNYGVLAAGSIGTHITENTVVSEATLRFIAICTDDIAGSHTEVIGNSISGYGVGLCIQTSGSELARNNINSGCVGAFMDPGVDGARLIQNHIGPTNPDCEGQWPVIGGIFVYGAKNGVVQGNVVEGQRAGGLAAGIIVVDAIDIDPSLVSSGNVVVNNVLRDNDFDLFVNTTGTGNVIAANECSTPVELCG